MWRILVLGKKERRWWRKRKTLRERDRVWRGMMKGTSSSKRNAAVRALENSRTDVNRWSRWEQCAVGKKKKPEKDVKKEKEKH